MISQFASLMAGLWTGLPFQLVTAMLSVVDPDTASRWRENVAAGASPLAVPWHGAWQAMRLPFMFQFVAGVMLLVVAVVAVALVVGTILYFARPQCSGRASAGAVTCR